MSGTVVIKQLSARVERGSLALFELGRASRDAPRVLAVHGITATSRAWLPLARALGDRACVLAPDLRGRGASHGISGPFGMAAHVADLCAILDQLELSEAVLAGHSLGAYIVAKFAVEHPERVRAVVLVDGGLSIPGTENVDPQAFTDSLLGPTIARLRMRFATRADYHDWWRAHPAFARGIAEEDLQAYADHDLIGTEPELRSSISEAAVRADSASLLDVGGAANAVAAPAWLLCAPRGLRDEPNPLQPWELVQAWAASRPRERHASLVADSNHYTILLAAPGAHAVADAVADALAGSPSAGAKIES